MKIQILNPSDSIEARKQLNLSQAKVANDIGLSRSYLSQFESGKRVLEDTWMEDLKVYYVENGWDEPNIQMLTAQNSGEDLVLTRDGFVVSEDLSEPAIEELLEERYKNEQLIENMRQSKLSRGFLFGNLDEEEAIRDSIPLLLVAARQCEIAKVLHGQSSENRGTEKIDKGAMETIGDYADNLCYEKIYVPRAEGELD